MSDFTVKVVSASWCSNCGPYKKQLEQQGIEFEDIDADEPTNMEILKSLGVRSLPTTLVYKDGDTFSVLVGNKVNELKEIIGG